MSRAAIISKKFAEKLNLQVSEEFVSDTEWRGEGTNCGISCTLSDHPKQHKIYLRTEVRGTPYEDHFGRELHPYVWTSYWTEENVTVGSGKPIVFTTSSMNGVQEYALPVQFPGTYTINL
jgi:hypothetical protein